MKVCKIKPCLATCQACHEMAMRCDSVPNCESCYNDDEYEIFDTHFSLFNSYVVIIKNGQLKKVDISRVYGIREKEGDKP